MRVIRRNVLIALVILNFVGFGTLLGLNIYTHYNCKKIETTINDITYDNETKLDRLYTA